MNIIQTIGTVIVFISLILFLAVDDLLLVLSDISSLLFFFFAMLAMFALSTAIAHQLVKKNHYKSMKKEYEILKSEISAHIGRFSYEINFTHEALSKHEELLALQTKVKTLRGDNYENDIINNSTDA